MAASRFIEQETGTYTGFRHEHNGYYAGDFSQSSRSGSERRVTYAVTARQAREPARTGRVTCSGAVMRIVSLVRPEYGGSSAGSTVRALLAVRPTVLLAVLLLAAAPTPAI